MTFRTILTVTAPGWGDSDLAKAASLCEEVGAHLSVLVMAIAMPPPVAEYGVLPPDIWVEGRREDTVRISRRLEEVEAFLAARGIPGDVAPEYPEYGLADEMIGRRGRHADLIVLGPDLHRDERLGEKVVEGALFSSGRPLLLIPEGVSATLKPKRVLVAWDSRVEAARAMREAIEMIAASEAVHLALVDPVEAEHAFGAEPGADAAAWLARHGAKVTVDRLPSQGKTVAAVLRRHAVDCGADLMVMGGYGHSRLRERIFGGVTRSFLEEPSLPILMAR